jgi:hypothetical protein
MKQSSTCKQTEKRANMKTHNNTWQPSATASIESALPLPEFSKKFNEDGYQSLQHSQINSINALKIAQHSGHRSYLKK